jgi:alpha-glucosidase (family GH31 glycosyl hydrolase)
MARPWTLFSRIGISLAAASCGTSSPNAAPAADDGGGSGATSDDAASVGDAVAGGDAIATPNDGSAGPDGAAAGACVLAGEPVPASERVPNGNPVLPPKWAFGVLFGSYFDQSPGPGSPGNLIDAMNKLRAEYSGDLMWIDSSWLSSTYAGATGARYICFQFDPQAFPDPKTMIGTLRQSHFHFGVWEWPWMDQGCSLYAYGAANKLFVRDAAGNVVNAGGWHGNTFTGAFDYTSPATVTWWNQDNQPLVDWGLDFLKLDTGGGPPGGAVLSDSTKDYRAQYHKAAYDLTGAYAAANDPVAKASGSRGFILTHLNGAPANDQTPGMWTGDSTASWAGLQAEMGLAAGLNGTNNAAYWCGDTGGYNGTPTDELYVRWLEYTAFTPCQEFFGAKTGSTGNRFPWGFSAQAQQIFTTYTQLRYRLLPFRYSNALVAYVQKPVAYPVRWNGTTQIVVGSGASEILVQPVTTQGATTATVSLPAGASWVEYWSGAVHAGGAAVTVPAPIDQEPVFVKAGSIVPMGPPLRWVDEKPADPLTLDVYPAGATSYTLYEDDGVSQGYMGGAYSTTKLSADDTSGHVVVTIGAQATAKHTYAGQLCARTYVLQVHQQAAAPAGVTRDGAPVAPSSAGGFDAAAEGWYYDAAAKTTWVKIRVVSSMGASVALG